MEERRLFIALALSFVVLTALRMLLPPPRAAKPSPVPVARASPSPQASQAPPREARAGAESSVPSPVAAEHEQRVEVNGPELALAFNNRGARLLSWKLKRFTDRNGRPEELVQVARGTVRPLDLETGDAALDEKLQGALFRPSHETLTLDGRTEQTLSFEYADDEVQVRKILTFGSNGYLVQVAASVQQRGQELPKRLVWGPGIGTPSPEEKAVQGYLPPHAVFCAEPKVERLTPEQLSAPQSLPAVSWAGVESTYFAALWIPVGAGRAEAKSVGVPGEDGKPVPTTVVSLDLGTSQAPALLFVGPKDYRLLSGLGHGLQRVVPIGDWIGVLVVPLMDLLRWVHGRVYNYGWSIVVLTVLINVVMAPLRHYSIANGMRMAKMAPEMKVIQERYRKVPALDPRRQDMQKEMGELYARHGMNMGTQMLVGCLPILLTLPFLWAFYRVLTLSIDLRGAAYLWIPDLSQKDPLFVTPLLMGVSMLVMQRMTPSTMDPSQQRIMMIMPLMLVVMFFAAPAGLNLYWLVSNLCSIVQQGATLKLLKAAEAERKERRRA